jgi:hypothetical protein
MIMSNFRTRYFEDEAVNARKGQVLPDGIYLDELDNPIFPCQVVVENGFVYYQDECDSQCDGPATKTNIRNCIATTKAYLRECKKMR